MAAKKKADAAVENTAEVTQESVQDTVEQMTEDNKKELDNKKFVVDHLLSTKREGMEDLIDYMEQIGFFEAPCSGGNHLACQFGLVHHSRNVMMAAENIGYALLGKIKYEEIRDSVIIAAALHDLGKCGDYGKQMYVPKSTFLDCVKAILGDRNISALDLKELGDRFNTYRNLILISIRT